MPIAPFQVLILPVNNKDEQVMRVAEDLYRQLAAEGAEVLLDDRDERPGVKFKDADMIGIPLRVTVGEKNVRPGQGGDQGAQLGGGHPGDYCGGRGAGAWR